MSNLKYLDITQTEEPIEMSEFSYLKDKDYPYICVGIQIKNKFDQERINLIEKHNPKNIFHFIYDRGNISCLALKTIPFKIKKEYKPFIGALSYGNVINFRSYENLLSEYNLSHSKCWKYCAPNTYAVNGEYISSMSQNNMTEEFLYENCLDTTKFPAFQSFGYFTIFILTNNVFITDAIKKEFCDKTGMLVE